jgi:hypothetical protein
MVKASEVTLVRTLKTCVAVEAELHALLTSYVCVCVCGGGAGGGSRRVCFQRYANLSKNRSEAKISMI